MRLKQGVNIQVLSRRSFARRDSMLALLEDFEQSLPQVVPTVCNWTDPVNLPWDLSDLSKIFSHLPPNEAASLHWRRRRKIKSEGYFDVGEPNQWYGDIDRDHGGVSFVAEREGLDVDALLRYIKSASVKFDGDLAQVHWVSPQEKSIWAEEFSHDMCGANGGSEFLTSRLRHWLPPIPWAVVFGYAYVQMFGLDRLLSAPAYKVEKLSDHAVFMQLSPQLSDLETDHEAVVKVRKQVQAHLGDDAFFDLSRIYSWRGPVGTFYGREYSEAVEKFVPGVPGTNGFRIPKFSFIAD